MNTPREVPVPESRWPNMLRVAAVPLVMLATFGGAARSLMAQGKQEAKAVAPAVRPLAAQRLAELIEKLGDDDFRAREDAHNELAQHGDRLTVKALLRAKDHPREIEGYDAERVDRASQLFLARMQRQTQDLFPEYRVYPWLAEPPKGTKLPRGMMPSHWNGDGWNVVNHYLHKVGNLEEVSTSDYVRYRVASTIFAKEFRLRAYLASLDAADPEKELVAWAQEFKTIYIDWQHREAARTAVQAMGDMLMRFFPVQGR